MRQIHLPEDVFKEAQRRASELGFSSVDEYVEQIVLEDAQDDIVDFDGLLTPERIAHADAAAAEIKEGKGYNSEESDVELGRRRAEWIRNNLR